MSTLLLIEDERDMRESLATSLRFEGFTVYAANDGASGMTLARQHQPDLIICDIQMPGLDGYDVLTAIRADPSLGHIPFIFLTARGEKRDMRRGMTGGADDYLVKPISLHDLLTAIQARLDRFAKVPQPHRPDFSDARPLEALGLSPKEAQTLLWVAQGKSNAETAAILGITEATAKKHLEHIFAKLGVEKRGAASLIAIETLSR
ncbi:MAG TPA: response regulator [Kiritimatiellia bacterium]|mgnify:CR=1 FL=1|nr:response regulator [Kiritimatiellia bacterium]HMO99479.1 response regulator [Kiritimatiellia bacterium]HMP97068.1 response regulator [Kiritimatiellia bacterium]